MNDTQKSSDISTPLVSIIIPAYNVDAYIGRCLESIYRQSFTSYEILIMDGNSADRTKDVVGSFMDLHTGIRFLSEVDTGTYDAMNKGVRLAKGDWLLFLGADDVLNDEDVLADASAALQNQKADVIYGDVVLVGDTPFGKNGETYGGPFDKVRIIRRNLCHQSIFYSRKVFEIIGNYDLAYKICADWDLNQRCFARLETLYFPRVITKFTSGGQSSGMPDQFSALDRAANACRYFNIGYFNTGFTGDSRFFLGLAKHFFKQAYFHKSIFFIIVALYQGRGKIVQMALRRNSTPAEK